MAENEVDAYERTKVPLLEAAKTANVPQGWPTSPQTIKVSPSNKVAALIFDIVLLASSIAFLAFAILVCQYDQAPTTENPIATRNILSAATYVWPSAGSICGCMTDNHRALQSFQSYLPQLSDVLRTPS